MVSASSDAGLDDCFGLFAAICRMSGIRNAIVPHGAAALRQRYLPPWGWANQNSDLRLACDATDDDEVTNPKIEIERRDVHAVGALPAAALDDRRDFAKEAALRRLGHT
jgi:hypothetical protein